uniref:Ubiquitin-like domain-containing protein n=1 Tax=Alexandrium monilatum TaxID=311494 RepID=A0A7S4PSL7_9DINO
MAEPPQGPSAVLLRSPSGVAHALEVGPTDTVAEMRAQLGERLGSSDDVDVVVLRGLARLDDGCAVASLGAGPGSDALSFVQVPGRQLRLLRSRLGPGWLDVDYAQYHLGTVLGLFPEGLDFADNKWIFWTDNCLGNWLYRALGRLVESGLLERNDEESQFRLAEDAGSGGSPSLLARLGETPESMAPVQRYHFMAQRRNSRVLNM